jgi:hypothetical protein
MFRDKGTPTKEAYRRSSSFSLATDLRCAMSARRWIAAGAGEAAQVLRRDERADEQLTPPAL